MDVQNGKHCMGQRWRDLHPLANHMTMLRKFTKEETHDFSAFRFSLLLMLEQSLINLIVCLMISQKLHKKVAQVS